MKLVIFFFAFFILTVSVTAQFSSGGSRLGDHCEQQPSEDTFVLSTQELQSPPGPAHSDGIVYTQGSIANATSVGLIYFSNKIVDPLNNAKSMGLQTGHCVEVEIGKLLNCYFNFKFETKSFKGRITAEANFDLVEFPNANLVITGGTGDFIGIVGSACTRTIPGAPATSFIYDFVFKLLSSTCAKCPASAPKAVPVVTKQPTPICKFRFCTGPSEFTVGKSADAPFTGKICHKDKLIGTIDESGEATLEDGTPISKYSPAGLIQKFSPVFFKTLPIKATKYVYSGIAHQLPQQNQGQFLDGKTWILPLKAYQVLSSKGDVTAELVGGVNDCIKFSTKI